MKHLPVSPALLPPGAAPRPWRLSAPRAGALVALLAVVLVGCGWRSGQGGLTPTPEADHPRLTELVNSVETRANVVSEFAPAQPGDSVPEGAQIRTGPEARALLDYGSGTRIRLDANTLVTLQPLAGNAAAPTLRMRLVFGKLWITLGPGSQFEAETAIGKATAAGKYAELQYSVGESATATDDDKLLIRCLDGDCTFANVVHLAGMQQLIITGGGLTILGPAALPASALDDFLANNPENVAVAQRPSATATTVRTATATASPAPSATASPTRTATPSATATATPSATATTPAPPPPVRVRPTATPLPTATPVPVPTATPVPLPTQAPPPAPTLPPPTNTPVPTQAPPPTAAPTLPPPTATTAPIDTAAPPANTPEPLPTREEPPTKTPSPAP